MAKLTAVCLALAGLSLFFPSEPSYDPWAWLVWGRELTHFGLDTTGGPSWKPLPVAFTTVVARLEEVDEGLAAALWMTVARAGALLAVALAFRLAFRLAGGGLPGVLGGAVAVYGLWAWRAHPGLRPLLAAVVVLMPLAWIVPEWLGSGNPPDGGKQARSEPVWSLSTADEPWLRALDRVHNHAGLAVELLALIAMADALVRRRWAVVLLAVGALAEVALFVAMTEAGFSGNPRYVLPALALGSVLAGAGAAALVRVAAGLPARVRRLRVSRAGPLPRVAGGIAGLALVAVLGAPFVADRARQLRREADQVGVRMDVHRDLAAAVDEVGGPRAVATIGTATANRALHSRLAWELRVPMDEVEAVTDQRVIFRSGLERLNGGVYFRGRAKVRQTLAQVGTIRVYRRDGITFPLATRNWNAVGSPFTGTLQGIHTSASGERNSRIRVVTR